MKTKKPKRNTSPVRLPSQIKHLHQSYFVYYINDIAVIVADELKKLTPKCEELFGKFPIPFNTGTDLKNFGVWVFEPRDESLWKLWLKIGTVFRECIWKDSRETFDRSHWFQILSENDHQLKEILGREDNIKKRCFQYVESLDEDELNTLRDKFSSCYNKPKEELDILELQLQYWLDTLDWIQRDNEYDSKIGSVKNSKLASLIEFQNDFDSLLKKFYLNKEWLGKSAFRAIWNGTGKLQINGYFREIIPEQIKVEIENTLKIPNNKLPFRETNIPLPNPFTYEEPYLIYDSFKHYEERAVEAYRLHLRNYLDAVQKSLKNHGYKNKQGNTYSFEGLQRLVYWNFSNFVCLWEVIQRIPEFEKVDVNNLKKRKEKVGILRKSFKEFERFDLPVRPYGDDRN
jgi:hypothetical protein